MSCRGGGIGGRLRVEVCMGVAWKGVAYKAGVTQRLQQLLYMLVATAEQLGGNNLSESTYLSS